MPTKLFNSIIVGPIFSRRLGSSLGINVLPEYGKICSFDCIYCELGWNKDRTGDRKIPDVRQVGEALEKRLTELAAAGEKIDSITFSGNGEPTMNPHFAEIVDVTIELRNRLYPKAKISVLSNSSMLWKEDVRNALMKIDSPILKIDSAISDYLNAINRPAPSYSLEKTIGELKKFKGNFILQTMFLKGVAQNPQTGEKIAVDCTDEEHCRKRIELVRELKPREIMMYSLDRDTPAEGLGEVTPHEMELIAQPLVKEGFTVMIRGNKAEVLAEREKQHFQKDLTK